jgi:5'-3' exonuclease
MGFVGNDFLPVEFCFTIKESHMENLLHSYKDYLKLHKKFINNKGVIDWSGIGNLLEIAKKFEANMIEEKARNKRQQISDRQYRKQSLTDQDNEEKES